MEFVLFDECQYRALEISELEQRRDAICNELSNAESKFTTAELRSQVEMCQAEFERRNSAIELRNASIMSVAGGAGRVLDRSMADEPATASDPYDTIEYRNAFMAYCQTGIAGAELRAGGTGTVSAGTTVTTGVAPQIPTTMGREIISKMSEYGTIWNAVRKLSVQGGLWFRVLDLKPTATWLQKGVSKTELSTSGYQKVENDATISFSFYMLECRMAQSLLAQAVTYDDFQALFVPAVAEAMVRALEAAIINGDGTGQFLGITKDERITNTTSMKAADMADWKAWHAKVKKKIPMSYRHGSFIMAQSTIDEYIETLADDNNAPVSIGYNPVTGEAEYRLAGMPIIPVEDDVLKGYTEASNAEVFAIYGNLNDYVVNTQPGMPMTVKRWIDEDANTEKIKALMAADGKVLDPYGFLLIKKDTSA